VRLHENGLLIARGGTAQACPWDTVTEVYQRLTTVTAYGIPLRTSHRYTLNTRGGDTYQFNNNLVGIEELGPAIAVGVAAHLLPGAREVCRAGLTVTFGKLHVGRVGIGEVNGELLPWNDVQEIGCHEGYLSVVARGRWLNWCNIPVANIPNLLVLLALVDEYRTQQSRADGMPTSTQALP
jgi:hypothetical protein